MVVTVSRFSTKRRVTSHDSVSRPQHKLKVQPWLALTTRTSRQKYSVAAVFRVFVISFIKSLHLSLFIREQNPLVINTHWFILLKHLLSDFFVSRLLFSRFTSCATGCEFHFSVKTSSTQRSQRFFSDMSTGLGGTFK